MYRYVSVGQRYSSRDMVSEMCLSAKVYARDRPCIYTRAGKLRAPEIIRSQ